jgi:hypothetical protein
MFGNICSDELQVNDAFVSRRKGGFEAFLPHVKALAAPRWTGCPKVRRA